MRRRGVSVLIVHHAGKGGERRGTSRREDVLDTSISLRRPGDYRSEQGARFQAHLERTGHSRRKQPSCSRHSLRFATTQLCTFREIEDVNLARVKALLDDGLTVREIADENGYPEIDRRSPQKADRG